jgi:hypothetical protein
MQQLAEQILATVNDLLAAQGLLLKGTSHNPMIDGSE